MKPIDTSEAAASGAPAPQAPSGSRAPSSSQAPTSSQAPADSPAPSGATARNGSPAPSDSPASERPVPVQLPRRLPIQRERPVQSNIPATRADRDRLAGAAKLVVRERGIAPPISMAQLRTISREVCEVAGLDVLYADYAAVLVNNATWRDELAQVPYERRLLLMPKCLRIEEHCPAPFDQFGMLCKECGLCSIEDLGRLAEDLGYAVLVAEGSAIVRAMVETGKIEAIVGVSCLNVLEKCFPHMEAVAIPGMSIPLLQDDCVNTNVDLDLVRDLIHLSSEDKTYRLDLEGLKTEVRAWFTPESLDELMGPIVASDPRSDRIARDWLARAGKRWRPYLAACTWTAITSEGRSEAPVFPTDLRKLAVAIECFHKASLIHDDIEDEDLERYGEDALHVEHGEAVALNVGDLLIGEGYRLIGELEAGGDVRAAMLAAAARAHVTLSRGQGAELCWAREPRALRSVEVLSIFREKTAPAFEVALRLGALLAGAGDDVHAAIGPYSEALGIAYQIRDDIDDFSADASSSGERSDLCALRPSLILAIAHKRASAGPERELLDAIWERRSGPGEHRAELRAFVQEKRILDKATELCDAYEHQAVEALSALTHASVKGLLRRVIGKIFGDEGQIDGYCKEFEARQQELREAGEAS